MRRLYNLLWSVSNFLDNITGIYQGPRWDSNSLDLLMIIRPSKAANGPFTLTLTAIDYLSGASVLSNPISFSWTAIPYAGPTFTPNVSPRHRSSELLLTLIVTLSTLSLFQVHLGERVGV